MLLNLLATEINPNSIIISLTPNIPSISQNEIIFMYNDIVTSIDSLTPLDNIGNSYKISFHPSLSYNDFVSIDINKVNYTCIPLTIAFREPLNEIILPFTLPNVPSNEYFLETDSINSYPITIKSQPLLICNGINSTYSHFEKEQYTFSPGNNAINLTLLDKLGNIVPNGNYTIKLTIKEEVKTT